MRAPLRERDNPPLVEAQQKPDPIRFDPLPVADQTKANRLGRCAGGNSLLGRSTKDLDDLDVSITPGIRQTDMNLDRASCRSPGPALVKHQNPIGPVVDLARKPLGALIAAQA
ncbi:MAG TPA: hypothetical protein VFS21_36020 [Roseiflexaceae bacterium]|nr:hypothetical protein [Roseiflexaceae bacterium]